jgi:hypothetical protein
LQGEIGRWVLVAIAASGRSVGRQNRLHHQARKGLIRSARAICFVCLQGALVSGFGFAATGGPVADAAAAKVFNMRLLGPNLRHTAGQAGDDVVIRIGVGVEDPAGEAAYSLGGATPEASELREKTCAADLIVVARPRSEYHSAFSEDGSSIFTLRRFRVESILRKSSAVPDVVPSEIVVGTLGGTVTVHAHKISMLRPSVADFRPGEPYLLFLRAIAGSRAFESPARSAYDISQDTAVSMVGAPLGLPAEDALGEIGSAATLCPYGPGRGALER